MKKRDVFVALLEEENIEFEREIIDINNIEMNSKKVKNKDLFIAIRGGNNFVNEALSKGAFVIYDNSDIEIKKGFEKKAFFVDDSIKFLQKLAKKWRESLSIKVIGITGSNGKTTVKDMIYHILSQKFKGKKTLGNYNNHIGLPFTLLRSATDDKFIILEMGMSDFGEIDLLGQIANPDINVITNIGESHLEFLKTKENVFRAKTEILPYIKDALIVNGDDKYLKSIKSEKIKVIKALNLEKNDFLENSENFYYGDIDFDKNNTRFTLKYFGQICKKNVTRNYVTNVLGEHNILNLTMAIAVAKQFGVEDKVIEDAIKNINLTDMRFQIIEKGKTVYINDAYNASPSSIEKSLETFSKIYNEDSVKKIIVLGDMLELGENELKYHADIYYVLKNVKFDKLYLFGKRMKSLFEKIENEKLNNKEIIYFNKKSEIKEKINEIKENKVVLLKASRGIKLEEIIEE
ncbi:UDP-N-acetylmuramoyl-tripeptide--D-alanyl-D-alanine ligase [Leptotrichia sp. oral taxon 847]|uniref:UDP-N-acetylmuramoyl-tripeptide--D-alanyl-D- alanine ligase n=1 Tax=Leptotrichia sp. oral taxon 847 TaxID=1785996 RepID=UPI000767F5A5|nr:UDP-N-acetylmuramoyl-tripeptide--D-alanyl-D-alanine ligase [Leptotrichia sp. oral taxon 847]AMD95056.1 UDP-N-acetylmuramoylalanyl-D-glutamate--2,6-diaminopimelate ligase [Leptotrichia sp. oral taxon 847]